jgi:hypothetical protein
MEGSFFRNFLHEFKVLLLLNIIIDYYERAIRKKDMIYLILIFAVLIPRVSIALLWFLTNWFNGMFHTLLWPILGFIFLPVTLLWYSVVFHFFDNSWGTVPIIGLVIALLIDMSPGGRRYYRRRDY